CLGVCPFDVPRFLPDGKMAKCDFCHDRIVSGRRPSCVQVCPTHALTVVHRSSKS
ncbi:MAG: 4Fe-4S ferredoxin, partial [Desulfosarcina sp.]|nr:4Fe-4S ferredoxin [Desulfobacterales bacterium]